MIDKIYLKNFTVFDELKVDFSSKINVIVGENGTGKTHLLKAVYALCDWDTPLKEGAKPNKKELGDGFADKLLKIFFPTDRKLVELKKRGSQGKSVVGGTFADTRKVEFDFGPRSASTALKGAYKQGRVQLSPVMIPTKELLSFLDGVSSKDTDTDTVERLFDDSYLHLFGSLLKDAKPVKSKQLDFDPRLGTVIPAICKAIGGQFSFHDGRSKFFHGEYDEIDEPREAKKDDEEVEDEARDLLESAPQLGTKYATVFKRHRVEALSTIMVAEGFKKIGMLQQLLLNGTLVPGQCGPLLWDEPEANMNPALMQLLVGIILELSRNGQQVILATHDYVLLKWLDLLSDSKKWKDHVRYHALHRDERGRICVTSTDDYLAINPNAIADTFGELYDAEVKRSFGGKK